MVDDCPFSEDSSTNSRKPSRVKKSEDADYSRHCREKKWSNAARALLPIHGDRLVRSDEASAESIEDVLLEMDSLSVPTAIVVDTMSLCVRDDQQSRPSPSVLPWPNNMPVTRSAVDSKNVALQSVGNFLESTWSRSSKLIVVKLLLLTSRNDRANASAIASQEDALSFILGSDLPQIGLELCPVFLNLRQLCFGATYGMNGHEAKSPSSTLSFYCGERKGKKRSRPTTVTRPNSMRLEQNHDEFEESEEAIEFSRGEGAVKTQLEVEKSVAIRRGELVASKISDGAHWIESGLAGTAAYAVSRIDAAGSFIKKRVQPRETPALNRRERIVTRTYTDVAKRVTGGVRVTSRTAASGIRGTSALGVSKMTQHFHERELGTTIVPDREQRDVLQAVGTIGLATLGAVVVISEAISDNSATVAERTAFVTSDIIEKWHGEDAGKIAKDTCESMGNVLGTVRDIHFIHYGKTTAVTKGVVKNTGKVKIKGESAMHQAPSRKMTFEYIQDLHQTISPLDSQGYESPTA